MEKRKDLETGLIAVRANCSSVIEKVDEWALETLVKRASKPNK
jgi:hypothetical protein